MSSFLLPRSLGLSFSLARRRLASTAAAAPSSSSAAAVGGAPPVSGKGKSGGGKKAPPSSTATATATSTLTTSPTTTATTSTHAKAKSKGAAGKPAAATPGAGPLVFNTSILGDKHDALLQWQRYEKANAELEPASRQGTLRVPLPDATRLSREEWVEQGYPQRIAAMARHDHVIQHVFPQEFAKFMPSAQLLVKCGDRHMHHGNILSHKELLMEPQVTFNAKGSAAHTLVLLNADGALDGSERQLVQWLVTDIRESFVSSGKVVLPFLPFTPYPNTGYHRCVAVLLQGDIKDLSLSLGPSLEGTPYSERYCDFPSFITQQRLQPVGLAFAHVCADDSVAVDEALRSLQFIRL